MNLNDDDDDDDAALSGKKFTQYYTECMTFDECIRL